MSDGNSVRRNEGPRSIPGQSTWGIWRSTWPWDTVSPGSSVFRQYHCSNGLPHIWLIYCHGYVIFVIDSVVKIKQTCLSPPTRLPTSKNTWTNHINKHEKSVSSCRPTTIWHLKSSQSRIKKEEIIFMARLEGILVISAASRRRLGAPTPLFKGCWRLFTAVNHVGHKVRPSPPIRCAVPLLHYPLHAAVFRTCIYIWHLVRLI
jgi:hypothetical protein